MDKCSKEEAICFNCQYAYNMTYDDEVLCSKNGISKRDSHCHKFKYDPLKRDPKRKDGFANYNHKDIEID